MPLHGELSEEMFRTLLEAAPDAMVIVDAEGRIVLVNQQAERMFAFTRDELLGKNVEVLMPAGVGERHKGHREGYTKDPRPRPMGAGLALQGRRKDGSEFPVEISLSPMPTRQGLFVTAAIRDITDRKRAEARFRALLEAAPDAMVIVGQDGVIELVNQQAERMFGRPRVELVGKPVEILMPERYRGAHVGHRGGFFTDPRTRPMGQGLELFGVRADGSEFPVEISLSPLESEHGVVVTAAIRDITERKLAERAMRAESLSRPLVTRIVNALVQQLEVPAVTVSEIGRAIARDVPQATARAYAETYSAMGLGTLRLDRSDGSTYWFEGNDLLERRPTSSQPTCHLALGFLEGAVGQLHGMRGLGTELKCQSLGHDKCVFVVKPRPAT